MLKPTQDYILVRPIVRKQSDIIHVVSNEKHCRGEVIAVGPGKPNKRGIPMPIDAKPGQIVAFGDGNFDFYPKYHEDGQDYRIIQEADIVFIQDGPIVYAPNQDIEQKAHEVLSTEVERLLGELAA